MKIAQDAATYHLFRQYGEDSKLWFIRKEFQNNVDWIVGHVDNGNIVEHHTVTAAVHKRLEEDWCLSHWKIT